MRSSRADKTSKQVQKRIAAHQFDHEEGEEYEGSTFGGFNDYFRRKKIKLQNLDASIRAESKDKPQIFKGVVAHINGYTQPSLNDLHKMIVQHGGAFLQYLDGKMNATHIIASTLTPKKEIEFRNYRIVKPSWIVDSIAAGRILPWNSYRVIDPGKGQKVLGFDNGTMYSERTTPKNVYREQSDKSWYANNLGNIQTNRSSSQRFLPNAYALSQGFVAPPPDTGDIADPDIADELSDEVKSKALHSSPLAADDLGLESSKTEESDDAIEPTDQDSKLDLTESQINELYDLSFEISQDKVEKAADIPEPESDQITSPASKLDIPTKPHQTGELENQMPPPPIPMQRIEKRPPSEDEESPTKKRKLTAEEHNSILLKDPNVWKSTVVNPNFLEQYYRESRLHHLSAWKADLKSEMQALADEKSASQKGREKRLSGSRRYIMHVDFDCFFAAVSLKSHPELKDKPVVVAHGTGTGSEIASCNYVARKYGVKNGMWMRKGLDLCPELKSMPYDFPAYEEASRAFYETIIATGGVVQSVSVDEALVDISMLCFKKLGTDGIKRAEGTVYREQRVADDIARKLREDIKAKTDCDVSIGIGANILLAKLALRKAKPAGQHQIMPEDVLDFIAPLEVQDLPGVAWSIGGKLEEIGIRFIKDVRETTKEKLINTLGPKTGEKLWEYARGIDRKEVGDIEIRKSVSAEVNWGVRFENQQQVDEFITSLCDELHKRLIKERVKGKQLTLKIMKRASDAPLDPPKHLGHGKCDTFSKAVQLGVSTNAHDLITKEILVMLKSFGFTPGDLRGIGVQMTKLEPIKNTGRGYAASSQRLLHFKPPQAKSEFVQDVPPIGSQNTQQLKAFKSQSTKAPLDDITDDPIQEMRTPQKPKTPSKVPFGIDHLNHSTPSRKPLNTQGTQFLLPTQIDPQVLNELPSDIRTKLLAAGAKAKANKTNQTELDTIKVAEPAFKIPAKPPAEPQLKADGLPSVLTALPNQSQIDPDTFNALPPDMQDEIRSFYKLAPGTAQIIESPRASPSPRLVRVGSPLGKGSVPAMLQKKGKGIKSGIGNATLTQNNFITSHFKRTLPLPAPPPAPIFKPKGRGRPKGSKNRLLDPIKPQVHPDLVGIDPEYLAALPAEFQKNVILGNRMTRIRRENKEKDDHTKWLEKNRVRRPVEYLHVPERALRPTFTKMKISSMPKLRSSISEWVLEFRTEGPYTEDTQALGKYLTRVIEDERDMNKCVQAIRWLKWVVEEELTEKDDAADDWMKAVDMVGAMIQGAVKDKGLGRIDI